MPDLDIKTISEEVYRKNYNRLRRIRSESEFRSAAGRCLKEAYPHLDYSTFNRCLDVIDLLNINYSGGRQAQG